ncbi:MAG: acetylglutamate kinase [Gemmataceae bacterium]|nr:acetylglutamate kinase [Gemmataceae bacterium]
MPSAPLSSEAFAAAVLRVARFRGRPVAVKLGGSAMEDPAATDAALRSVAALHFLGLSVVVVHGGGKPIDRAMAEAGLTPKKVGGRRYTDDATLEIVVRVLKDEINPDLVGRLKELGGHPVARSSTLVGERMTAPGPDGRPIDLGRVGRVTDVDHVTLDDELNEGFLPVIPPLALDADGGWLNLNADDAAAAVAGALGAQYAIFLTDTPGVLRDRRDPASLIPKLSAAECRALIASGVIDGGMIPKVEACFAAHDAGVPSALILDGRVPYSLLDVFLRDTFTGTEITR